MTYRKNLVYAAIGMVLGYVTGQILLVLVHYFQ
jgi:hypothetical protein